MDDSSLTLLIIMQVFELIYNIVLFIIVFVGII